MAMFHSPLALRVSSTTGAKGPALIVECLRVRPDHLGVLRHHAKRRVKLVGGLGDETAKLRVGPLQLCEVLTGRRLVVRSVCSHGVPRGAREGSEDRPMLTSRRQWLSRRDDPGGQIGR